MKINQFKSSLRSAFVAGLLAVSTGLFVFTSCDSDEIPDETLYTFKDKTLGQYLQDSTKYSEFCRLLDTTQVMGLLKSFGNYTCFAPTNEAMVRLCLKYGRNDLSEFPMDTLKKMAYDHVVDGWVVKTSDFVDGRLPQLTMSGRYISVKFKSLDSIYINDSSFVLENNIIVHNGVIHTIDEALNPTRDGITKTISKAPEFSIFYEALILTHMADSLEGMEDLTYNPDNFRDLVKNSKDQAVASNSWNYDAIPEGRKYGYTVFMESNATMKDLVGIDDIGDLKTYAASIYDEMYPEDAIYFSDPTHRKNSLNRFVSYHLINKEMSYLRIIDAYDEEHMIKNVNMYEYLEPMLEGSLIEVVKDRSAKNQKFINRFYSDDKGIQINPLNKDRSALNGVYHEIDGMLVYSTDVESGLSSKRLRFDAASFFPELTNNNMRGQITTSMISPTCHYKLPYRYIDRIKCSEQTTVGYLLPYHRYQDYQGDEIFLSASSGKLYDFEITTPCVPAGTYEVRFGYQTNGKRGVAQLYFDGKPCGVPLNLNNNAKHQSIGWQSPDEDPEGDPGGFLNDKMMRNRGFMKGPACFKVVTEGWSYGVNSRYSEAILRKILGTYIFDKSSTHVLKVRGLSGGEFMFDYLEFVPTSVLETEDIY